MTCPLCLLSFWAILKFSKVFKFYTSICIGGPNIYKIYIIYFIPYLLSTSLLSWHSKPLSHISLSQWWFCYQPIRPWVRPWLRREREFEIAERKRDEFGCGVLQILLASSIWLKGLFTVTWSFKISSCLTMRKSKLQSLDLKSRAKTE